jgi:hypothetical protein
LFNDLGEIGQVPRKGDFDPLEDAKEGGNIIECKTINNGIVTCGFLPKSKY